MAVIPKEIARKIDDLTQTLECTEQSLTLVKSENAELKKENENLQLEIIKLKARLYDLTTQNWY